MKCMPMTASGRRVDAATRVMGMDEVLVASTPPGLTTASSSWKTRFFTSSFSVTASMATSTSRTSRTAVWVSSRPRAAASVAASSLPFSRSLPKPARIRPRPFSTASSEASTSDTRHPATSATWAIPAPICPAPTTNTCSFAMAAGRLQEASPSGWPRASYARERSRVNAPGAAGAAFPPHRAPPLGRGAPRRPRRLPGR